MARGSAPRVEFAQSVKSIRAPRADELSVMRHFANHAHRCDQCADPYRTWKAGGELCDHGHNYARDVAKYLYAKGARPHSVVDKEYYHEVVEVEVPVDCEPIRSLIRAFDRGLSLRRRTVVSNDKNYYVADRPREERRYRDVTADVVEVKPGSSRQDRKDRERYRDEKARLERRKTIHLDSRDIRGSLYQRDVEEKKQQQKYDEEPIIIYAQPRKYRR